jgi:response regulator NasT
VNRRGTGVPRKQRRSTLAGQAKAGGAAVGTARAARGRLRVIIVEGSPKRVEEVSAVVGGLGHCVIAVVKDLPKLASLSEEHWPDVAIVIVGDGSEGSLGMIRRIVTEAACPVIAVLDTRDRTFVTHAAKLGIFASIVGGLDPEEFQSTMEIALCRFAEYHDLEGAFGRRAITERAKGVLMERHAISEEKAFNMLRDHSRVTGRKIVELAEAVLASHLLLPGVEGPSSPQVGQEQSRGQSQPDRAK